MSEPFCTVLSLYVLDRTSNCLLLGKLELGPGSRHNRAVQMHESNIHQHNSFLRVFFPLVCLNKSRDFLAIPGM